MSKVRNRGKNFSDEECLLFLNIVETEKYIIENKSTNAFTNKQKAIAWEKITTKYNSCTAIRRTTEQLQGKYENLKNHARNYAKNKKYNTITDIKGNLIYEKCIELINKKSFSDENSLEDDRTDNTHFMSDQPASTSQINRQENNEEFISTESLQNSNTYDKIIENVIDETETSNLDTPTSIETKISQTTNKKNKKQLFNVMINKLTEAKLRYYEEKTEILRNSNNTGIKEEQELIRTQILKEDLKRKRLINDFLRRGLQFFDNIINKYFSTE